jgi:hypothetical protein
MGHRLSTSSSDKKSAGSMTPIENLSQPVMEQQAEAASGHCKKGGWTPTIAERWPKVNTLVGGVAESVANACKWASSKNLSHSRLHIVVHDETSIVFVRFIPTRCGEQAKKSRSLMRRS